MELINLQNMLEAPGRGKIVAVAVLAMMFFTSFQAVAYHNESGKWISLSYSFDTPESGRVIMGNKVYDTVSIGGGAYFGSPGEPSIPVKGAYILLPQGTEAGDVKVVAGGKTLMGYGYRIAPIGRSVPTIKGVYSPVPAPGPVYKSGSEFPGELFTKVGTYTFRGYSILVLRLYPVQYVPSTGEVFYYKDMTVYVDTVPADNQNPLFRGLEKDRREVMKRVDNPEVTSQYGVAAAGAASDSYDMLILTTESLKKYFEPLKDYHDSHGVSTVIETLDDVGGSTPEDIRDYIRDAYSSMGIEYVLIGGDDDVVPAKTLWVHGMDENITPYETYMPSDLYYSCLDGTYNYDGDSKWGEPTDGDGGHDVDLVAEVYVGRACVGDKTEVGNFVDKTVAYMSSDADPYLKKILLAGEYLGDYGVASWGGNYLDQIINGSSLDGYTTMGIPPDMFDIEKMYDRDWQGNYWTREDMMGRINEGEHIIQHDGHSSYTYNMRMVNDDVGTLTNTKYCFIYSNGCMSGGFDQDDCIAEYFTAKEEHGAFAGIWNARYGWFWSYNTDGDSQRFVREFWDGVFGENIRSIGMANQDSREDNIYIINRSCIRWTYYELNLFGDPSVALRINNAPDKPAAPSGPSSGKTGEECSYTAVTTDIEGDKIYYMFDWGDGSTSDWLGPYDSGQPVNVSHSWEKRGTYGVKVKAKDTGGAESDWSDPSYVRMPRFYGGSMWQLVERINEWFASLFGFGIIPFFK